MRSTIQTITLTFFVLLMLTSCGNDNEVKNDEQAMEGMYAFDLSEYGKPFAIWVPDTSASQLTVNEEADGALQVISGRNFGINIYEQETDLELKRDDLKHDEVNRFRKFILEEENGLIWESAITEPEYHFVFNKRVEGSEYSFQEIPGNSYSRGAVEDMYKSAKLASAK